MDGIDKRLKKGLGDLGVILILIVLLSATKQLAPAVRAPGGREIDKNRPDRPKPDERAVYASSLVDIVPHVHVLTFTSRTCQCQRQRRTLPQIRHPLAPSLRLSTPLGELHPSIDDAPALILERWKMKMGKAFTRDRDSDLRRVHITLMIIASEDVPQPPLRSR